MPDYSYAILSALLWSVSAPVINHGLRKIPEENRKQWLSMGLLLAMLFGAATLSPFLLTIDIQIKINIYLVLAGIFTFPLATGTYYLSGIAFSGRTEFASQFSKVKPLLSFALAVFVLHEAVTNYSLISISLIALGTLIFIWAASINALNRKGVALGLLTAIFWALGEMFMKLGLAGNHPILANLVAIASGIVIFTVIVLASWRKISGENQILATLWPFILHGIISFGTAYSLFFFSIKQIGLAHTVLINAFWPILSILITAAIRATRLQPVNIPPVLMLGTLILLLGSLVQVYAYL